MVTGKREVHYRLAISLFCAIVLGLQGATIVATLIDKPVWSWYWPIIDYPMYHKPHVAGDHVNATFLLEATLRDGSNVNITRDDLGLNIWNFLGLTRRLAKGDAQALKQLQLLHPKGDLLSEVRVRTQPIIVTKEGMREQSPVLLNRISVEAER